MLQLPATAPNAKFEASASFSKTVLALPKDGVGRSYRGLTLSSSDIEAGDSPVAEAEMMTQKHWKRENGRTWVFWWLDAWVSPSTMAAVGFS